jgi:uncharacterized membrane protein
MTTFTVWKFTDPRGAGEAARALRYAEKDGLVQIHDHAVVSWPVGAPRPTTEHVHEGTWRGAGWGALWGVLLGALFFVPVIGGVVGAGIGVLSRTTEGTGISEDELARIRVGLTEGTSALFAVTENGDLDRLGERFHGMHSTLVTTNLTDAERRVLLETFGR